MNSKLPVFDMFPSYVVDLKKHTDGTFSRDIHWLEEVPVEILTDILEDIYDEDDILIVKDDIVAVKGDDCVMTNIANQVGLMKKDEYGRYRGIGGKNLIENVTFKF